MKKHSPVLLRQTKLIKSIPNFLTICNSLCGFAAILLLITSYQATPERALPIFVIASAMIFSAMIFDVFDGLAASTMTPVPLTTVVLPLRQLAERTVELLLTRMEGKKDERKFLLPVTLRIGESCGCSVPFDFGFYWERIPPVLENTEDNENINDTISLSEQITERKK